MKKKSFILSLLSGLLLCSPTIGHTAPLKDNQRIFPVIFSDSVLVKGYVVSPDGIIDSEKTKNGIIKDEDAIKLIKGYTTQKVEDKTYVLGKHMMYNSEIRDGTYTFNRKPMFFFDTQIISVINGMKRQGNTVTLIPEERKYSYDIRTYPPRTSIGDITVDITISTTSPGSKWFNPVTRTYKRLHIPVEVGVPHDLWFIVPQKSTMTGVHRVLLVGIEPFSTIVK